MDERNNKSDGTNESNGSPGPGGIQGRNGGLGRARPSGSNGSKISSRASEHSIAKLMETLEATAGTNLPMGKSKGIHANLVILLYLGRPFTWDKVFKVLRPLLIT